MTTYTCLQLRDVAPELALGVLGGAERGEALTHLATCSRCQVYVAELTEAADVLPLLAEEREPPPGFEARVIGSLSAERRRVRRRWYASVAAAVAAATIVSITLVRVIDAGSQPVAAPATSSAPITMTTAQMLSENDGAPAGWAYVSGGRSVAVEVAYSVAPGTYGIQVRAGHGNPVMIGDVEVTGYRGSWSGTSSVDIAPGDTIALVSTDGAQVCHGTVA
ncbi:MAG: hypothetical protein ACHQIG_10880 [Acidimicrobiia bacterium]